MTNREIETILTLKDNATANYNRFVTQVEESAKRITSVYNILGNVIIGAFSIGAIKSFISESNQAEMVSNRLKQSLINIGVYTPQLMRQMEDYSKALQNVTIYGDEVIKDVMNKLISVGGVTGESLKELTKITLDFASGMGVSADEAANLIAKTIAGTNTLGRYGIQIKDVKDQHERLNIVISELSKRFGGLSGSEAKTFAGRMKQINEVMNELKETIGEQIKLIMVELMPVLQFIAGNIAPVFITAINSIKIAFAGLYKAILLPFSLLEQGLNLLGIHSDKTFQNLEKGADKLINDYIKEIGKAWDTNSEKVQDWGKTNIRVVEDVNKQIKYQLGSLQDLEEQEKRLRDEISRVNINTESGRAVFEKLNIKLNEVRSNIELLNKQLEILQKGFTGEYELKIRGYKIDEVKLFEELKVLETQIPSLNVEVFDIDKFENELNYIKEGINLISQFSAQATELNISNIEMEKEARLGLIDAELKGQNITEARRAQLLRQREALEKEFNARIRAERIKAFENHKIASILEATINTALAVTKALAQGGFVFGIPMSTVVAALGAAQIALIASQPTPRFHKGGVAKYDAPSTSEAAVIVRGGETIRVNTEEQERNYNYGNTFIFNFDGANIADKESFKKIIEQGMREMGIDNVVDYFKNNKRKVTL